MLTFIHMLGGYALFSFLTWIFVLICSIIGDADGDSYHKGWNGLTAFFGFIAFILWAILFTLTRFS